MCSSLLLVKQQCLVSKRLETPIVRGLGTNVDNMRPQPGCKESLMKQDRFFSPGELPNVYPEVDLKMAITLFVKLSSIISRFYGGKKFH